MRSAVYSEIISMFFMNNRPGNPFDPKVNDFKKLVRYALEMAFNDFNFRTLTKTAKFKKEYEAWEEKEKNIRKQQKKAKQTDLNPEPKMTAYLMGRLDDCGFLDRFVTYFNENARNQAEFDTWHHETCELFLDVLNGEGDFLAYTKVYTSLQYGKAQKIVNMMFKHLYCLNGADAYAAHFEHCHMVLDNFTLEWFKQDLGEKRIESWSNLVYKKPSVDHDDYLFYQEKIRNYFLPAVSAKHTYSGLTPFQAEFYIWPEIQWRMAAESLLRQNLLDNVLRSGSKIVEDADVASQCDALMKQLTALQNAYK